MSFLIVLLLGVALVLLLPGKTVGIAAVGAIAGFLHLLAVSKWPRAKPAYIDPINRSKPRTAASGYVAAIFVAFFGVISGIICWILTARFPLAGMGGVYMSAVGVGLALGIALTARRSADEPNRWLAAMPPLSKLDF